MARTTAAATAASASGQSPDGETKGGLPVLPFASASAWEHWLELHHDEAAGVWLKIAKKGSGIATVSYEEAVEVGLCFGWIDGMKGGYDDRWFLQRFTPRRPRSKWSEVNVAKAEELIAAGRMRPAGLLQVEQAKEDGRWAAAYGRRTLADVPPDFQAALDANPKAADFFATVSRGNRYAMLYRLHDAKQPETRQRRIAQFVAMLEHGETLH